MNSFLKIRLQEDLLGIKNLLAMLGVFSILFLLVYGYFYTTENIIYHVGILDHDQSVISKDIVNGLKSNDQIRVNTFGKKDLAKASLKNGEIDVLYEINQGFEESLKQGKKDNLIKIHKESTMKITAWLNDFVSIRVLKTWTYYDIFNRINQAENLEISTEDYSKLYHQEYENNQLIDLEIHSIENALERRSTLKVLFALVSGCLILIMTLFYGKNILHEKRNNILSRLEVSGYSKATYYATKIIILLLFLMIPIIAAYTVFLLIGLFSWNHIITNLFLLLSFILITFIIFMLFVFWFNDEGQYLLVGQTYILLNILFSLQGVSDIFSVLSYIKWLFPMQYLVEYLL